MKAFILCAPSILVIHLFATNPHGPHALKDARSIETHSVQVKGINTGTGPHQHHRGSTERIEDPLLLWVHQSSFDTVEKVH